MILKKIAVFVIFLGLFSSSALAATNRFSILYYRPAIDNQDWIQTLGTATLRDHDWLVATQFDYGYHPIEFTANGNRTQGVIDHLLVQHVMGAFAFSDQFAINLDIPAIWYNKFGDPAVTSPALTNKMGIGDVMLRGRINLSRRDEHPLGFGLVPFMTIPTGNENHFVGDEYFTGGMLLAVDTNLSKKIFLGLNTGIEGRDALNFNGLEIKGRLLLSGGIGFHATKAWTLETDVMMATPLNDLFSDNSETPSELFLGTNYQLGKSGFTLDAGGSLSLIRAAGTPLYRGLFGLSYMKKNKTSP